MTYLLWVLVWCRTYHRRVGLTSVADVHNLPTVADVYDLPTVGTGDVIHTARPRLLLFLSQWLSEGQGDWEHGSSTKSEMTGKYLSVLGYIVHGWAAVSSLSSKGFRLYGDGSRDRIPSVALSYFTPLPACWAHFCQENDLSQKQFILRWLGYDIYYVPAGVCSLWHRSFFTLNFVFNASHGHA